MPKDSVLYKNSSIFFLSMAIFFFGWIVAYKTGINKLAIQSEDTIPALFLPIEIIKSQSLYLDKYYSMMIERYPQPDDKQQVRGLTPFYLKKVGNHYLSAFPIITPLLALPIYAIPVYFNMAVTWDNLIFLGHLSGAFVIALSGMVLFSLAVKHLSLEKNKAFLLTAIYLFGTVNFALLSQAMWQHGTVELFSLLAVYMLFERKWLLMSMSLGLAILSRPTAALIVPFLGLLVFHDSLADVYHKIYENKFKMIFNLGTAFFNTIIKMALGMFLPFAFFAWYTNKFYLGISNNGYASQFLTSWLSPFPQGWLGMWFSPSKGILVYSPVIFFAFVGLWFVFRRGNWRQEQNLKYIIFGSIFLIHTLVLSIWKHWYGGWGFGYRMASDTIPFMILCIVPFLKSEAFVGNVIRKELPGKFGAASEYYVSEKDATPYVWLVKLFWITVVFSVLVQIGGLFFFDGIWHAAYDRGFRDTAWLWSWQDSEFMFNVRRVLVKVGMLERACPKCL